MVFPVILAGGSGSRLWPVSDKQTPKQFLNLFNDKSLFQNTVTRLTGFCKPENMHTACNQDHAVRIEEEIMGMGLPHEKHVIAEPIGRNTAPAIYMATAVVGRENPEATLVILPADHYVADVPGFQKALGKAVDCAREGKIVTLGIQPNTPETGYGYIESAPGSGNEARRVEQFVEKPDAQTAARYLISGRFLWNSGIFVFQAKTMMEEFATFQPEVVKAVDAYLAGDEEAYARSPKISIDYAIMEHTRKAMVVPSSFGWSDVGTWSAVHQQNRPDDAGNTTSGDVILQNCRNSLVRTSHQRVAALGLQDIMVVASPGGVLVCHKDHDQAVSEIGSLPMDHEAWGYQEHRPWGSFTILGSSESYKTKRLDILPGRRISLQSHKHRTEYWIVVSGQARVTRGEAILELGPTDTVTIPALSKHRLENPGENLLTIIEVQLGSYFGEDDIERFQDDFGRK